MFTSSKRISQRAAKVAKNIFRQKKKKKKKNGW